MSKVLAGMLFGAMIVLLVVGAPDRTATADLKDEKEEFKPIRVALVDMAKVFKSSREFEKKRELLKVEIAEDEVTAKEMQNELNKMKKDLERLEKGSEDRASLEARGKAKLVEFEKFRTEARDKFLKAEANIYLEVYENITSEVASYAREHNIDLVMRFNAEPLEKDDPGKLLNSMNRQVVYENGLDITDDIIALTK